jgi:signal peptidase I
MKTPNDLLIEEMASLLDEGIEVTFKVKGHSMWPFYQHDKTNVTLKRTPVKRLDVVLARHQNRYVLHRILKVKSDYLVLRGDGAVLKETITREDIIGTVISHQTKKLILESDILYRLLVILHIYNPFRRLYLRLRKHD